MVDFIIDFFLAILCFISFGLFGCEDDSPNPAPEVTLRGLSNSTFNAPVENVTVVVENGSFDASGISFMIDSAPLDPSSLIVNEAEVTALVPLNDGKYSISFTDGTLEYDGDIWVGIHDLMVNIVFETVPFLEETQVLLKLADNLEVQAQAETSTGSVSFSNVPSRTILITGTGPSGQVGSSGVVGGLSTTTTVDLGGFSQPSIIDNNDFEQGTDGWELPTDPGRIVEIVPHNPNPGPENPLLASTVGPPPKYESRPVSERGNGRQLFDPLGPSYKQGGPVVRQLFDFFGDNLENQDLCIDTSFVEGETAVSRVFSTPPGSTMAYVRYRFVTSEVPGGYFGTQFNDYFRISLRTEKGSIATEIASMNGLGLAAFLFSTGETAWRDVWLALDEDGDTIALDGVVANVGDNLLQSKLCIDFVEVWDCGIEELDAVLAVGFFDAWEAGKTLADEAKVTTANSGLTGFYQGPADAFRHCYWNCRMAQEIGQGQAQEVGTLHEACNPEATAADIGMDTDNNDVGRTLAGNGDCSASCLSALNNGDLTVLNPSAMP